MLFQAYFENKPKPYKITKMSSGRQNSLTNILGRVNNVLGQEQDHRDLDKILRHVYRSKYVYC